MATINSAKRNTSGDINAGALTYARTIDFIVDFANDFTMGTATDVINLATLPKGAVVIGAFLQQITAGTGSGTVALRVGTTSITATLASTAAAEVISATVPAAIPLVVPEAGAELNLLGATAVRTDGVARVTVVIVEGDKTPRQATTTDRDALA